MFDGYGKLHFEIPNMKTNTTERPRRGRPPLAKGEKRSVYRAFMLTKEEDERARAASESEGVDVSEWMRRRLFGKAA